MARYWRSLLVVVSIIYPAHTLILSSRQFYFKFLDPFYLPSHSLQTVTVSTLRSCAALCADVDNCNVIEVTTSGTVYMCDLRSFGEFDVGTLILSAAVSKKYMYTGK